MSNSHKRRGIIFDLDNTLLPTFKCHVHAMDCIKKQLEQQYSLTEETSADVVKTYQELCSQNPFDPHDNVGMKVWRMNLLNESVKEKATPGKEIDVEKLYDCATNEFLDGMVFSKEVISMLLKLREDYKLAILTNGHPYWQDAKLERCSAVRYVDEVLISGQHNLQKPDPKIFHLACRKIGLENKQCIMVGDNMSTDILGGQNSGMKATVLLSRPELVLPKDHIHVKPDYFISRIYDLISVLKKINW